VAALLLRARAALLAATLAVVVALGALSVRQQAAWHDDVSLYVHTLETLGDDPYRVDLYDRLGDLYTRRGDLVHAVRAWDGAIAAQPDTPHARYERARARFRLGDFAGSVADTDVLLGLHEEPALRELRGLGLAQLGRLDDAIVELARAAPGRPSAAHTVALVVVVRATVGTSL